MNNPENIENELACIIVDFGLGRKIIHIAKQQGVSGGTVLLGKGTINNRLLEFIGLSDIRKEIVLMISERKKLYKALDKLNEIFNFARPNHGVAFTMPICAVLGTRTCTSGDMKNKRGVDNIMYQAITVIVDKGKSQFVIDAATKAGSKGGTVINGRGSGIHETNKLFSMEIEPEKEIVIIISETAKTESIVALIREELKIDEPGNGIIYIQDINKTYGLYK